jgi:hypothetical protein
MNKRNERAFAQFLIARVECLRQSRRVVGDVEDYRIGIVCDGRCPNKMESGTIINYHHYKFKNIDQHKHAVVIVGLEL